MLSRQTSETCRHRERLKDAVNQMGIVGAIGAFEAREEGLPASLSERIQGIQSAAAVGCVTHLTERRTLLSRSACGCRGGVSDRAPGVCSRRPLPPFTPQKGRVVQRSCT